MAEYPYLAQLAKLMGPTNKAKGLLVPGTITNLYNRPMTVNPAGPNGYDANAGYSTTYSKSFEIGGKEVLLPTVVNGKFLTDNEAVNRFHATGEHLGMFDTPENASNYATALHNSQEAITSFYSKDQTVNRYLGR